MAWAGWENYVPPASRAATSVSALTLAAKSHAPNKFNARARCICGINVGSEKEGRRVVELLRLQAAGEITQLEFHPRFELVVNGIRIGKFTPDAKFITKEGEVVVEDTKSPATARLEAYRLRRKLWEALYFPLVLTER